MEVSTSRIPTREDLKAAINEGLGSRALAARFGVTTRTITRWRKMHGLSGQAPPVPMPPEKRERALVLLREGMPATWIAEDLNVNTETIREMGRKLGAPRQEAVTEWQRTWIRIRNNTVLFQLHESFTTHNPEQIATRKDAA